jgi:hypothetical protein
MILSVQDSPYSSMPETVPPTFLSLIFCEFSVSLFQKKKKKTEEVNQRIMEQRQIRAAGIDLHLL